MPTPKELYGAGNLRGAIDALTQEIKANPTDKERRTFLFELLSFAGEWDRAEKQLDAIVDGGDTQTTLAIMVYKANVKAERERVKLFTQGTPPHFLNEPLDYVDRHVEALRLAKDGKLAEARAMLDTCEDDRPAVSGTLGGEPFEDFRDYDDFVGPVLELIVKDKYVWLPFQQIKKIDVSSPKKLRDLIWAPARIEALDGTTGEVFVSALYAGSAGEPDDMVKLGRMTDWKKLGEDVVRAVGLKTYLVGEHEKTVFELKNVQFDTPYTEPAKPAPAPPEG